MKDFIKEFGDDQSKKTIPITFEPEDEWGFEPDIEYKDRLNQKSSFDDSDQQSFPAEETITLKELKKLAMNLILEYMNTPDFSIFDRSINEELIEEQKKEIKSKVNLYESRPGFMSMTFHSDFDKNECILGARVDPTNNKDWILTKEEIVYKLPYSYKNSLYEFVSSLRKK